MKKSKLLKCNLWILASLILLVFTVNKSYCEERSTGWQCPAGSCDRNASSDEGDYNSDGGYPGHVGIDYMRDVGYSIYAIEHGIIIDYNPNRNYYGSACGAAGGAMLVRHIARGHDGYSRTFYALYGHMYKSSWLNIGDIVEKGDVIGNIHQYYGDANNDGVCNDTWPHLHFGIKPDVEPLAGTEDRFRGVCSEPGDCGWTHPMNFLDDNFSAVQEVSCNKLEDKYPNEMANKSCVQAFYEPPNQYQVWEYWWQGNPLVIHPNIMKFTTFQIGDGNMVEVAVNYGDPSEGYGGGGLSPASGNKPDLTPDFDILYADGHEISSNCDNCPTENVDPNQVITMRLEAQTNNRDVETSDLFNSNSQSIDGEVWCRIRGITDWQEIPGSEDVMEFDVDNLITDNNTSLETLNYTVPNYPGEILDCKANIDSDDEVNEQSENNNNSRIESFFITIPNQIPTGYLDSANCNQFTGWARDANTTNPIAVHFYADGEAGVGTFIGSTTANQYRGDLPFDDKNHEFVFRTPESIKDGHQHYIYAYGIDDQSQINPLLNNSPLNINHCVSLAVMQVLMKFLEED